MGKREDWLTIPKGTHMWCRKCGYGYHATGNTLADKRLDNDFYVKCRCGRADMMVKR